MSRHIPQTRKELFKARLKTLSRLERGLEAIYKDQLPGGVGDEKTPEDFKPEVVKEGAEHEMEHTYDPELATEIAVDHLSEDPDYYNKIESHTGGAEFFLRSIRQVVGNKVYMRDLDALFERIELTPNEIDSLDRLARDLKSEANSQTQRNNSSKNWRGGF